jgi:hypothetical protein
LLGARGLLGNVALLGFFRSAAFLFLLALLGLLFFASARLLLLTDAFFLVPLRLLGTPAFLRERRVACGLQCLLPFFG